MEYYLIEGLGLIALFCLIYSSMRIFKQQIDSKTVFGLLFCIALDNLSNILSDVYLEGKKLISIELWIEALKFVIIILFVGTIIWFVVDKILEKRKIQAIVQRRRNSNHE